MKEHEFKALKAKIETYERMEREMENLKRTLAHINISGEKLIITSHYGNGSGNTACEVNKKSPYYGKIEDMLILHQKWIKDNLDKL